MKKLFLLGLLGWSVGSLAEGSFVNMVTCESSGSYSHTVTITVHSYFDRDPSYRDATILIEPNTQEDVMKPFPDPVTVVKSADRDLRSLEIDYASETQEIRTYRGPEFQLDAVNPETSFGANSSTLTLTYHGDVVNMICEFQDEMPTTF